MFWSNIDLSEATTKEMKTAIKELKELLNDPEFKDHYDSIQDELDTLVKCMK